MRNKPRFNKKIAREIADRSFGHVLDCVLGYSDPDYDLRMEADMFEQNFEEDLEEKGITVTPMKIRVISEEYDKMKAKFEAYVRKKYYKQETQKA